jgi:UDP-N-acetylglucosamine acyltransferase
MSKISPLSYVHPDAKIGDDCEIDAFCYIDKNVEIGAGNHLMNSVTLLSGTRLGSHNTLFPGAVIGAVPQDLKFRGEETTAEIGDHNTIRENVTINRGTAAKNRTVVGSHNLLMEGMHVAHDVVIGNGCIIGKSTKIAGEVVIDDFAIISANVLIHQFCRVGSYVMVGGGTRTSQDIPPFATAAREPVAYCGLNLVGLRRRGFSPETIEHIHNAYRLLYQGGKREDCLAQIRAEVPQTPEVEYLLRFVESSKRGIIK